MSNCSSYVKAYSLAGDLVFGQIVRIADRLHILELTQNLTYGTSINIVPIDSTKFAKRIAEVPTGDSIFEFDMFISPDNDLFYVT